MHAEIRSHLGEIVLANQSPHYSSFHSSQFASQLNYDNIHEGASENLIRYQFLGSFRILLTPPVLLRSACSNRTPTVGIGIQSPLATSDIADFTYGDLVYRGCRGVYLKPQTDL